MDIKTAEKNFYLIDKHPKGNFYVNKNDKIIEISKWNLIGRIIKHYSNRNGDVREKVNSIILETLKVVNKEPLQKQAVLDKIAKTRGISLQVLDEKIQNITAPVKEDNKPSRVPSAPSVEKIDKPNPVAITMPVTGFANGGNTCFLAAALQVLRSIPVVHEHLDRKAPLEKRFNAETDETLSLRQKAKDHAAHLIHTIDLGQPVSGDSIKELEKIYAELNPNVNVGKGNDVSEVFNYVIHLILDIRSERNTPLYVNMYGERSEEETLKITERQLNSCLKRNEEIPKILPFSRPDPDNNQANTPPFSLQDVITLTSSDGRKFSYRLVGTVRSSGFHAVAYLRDHQQNQWTACDDAKIHRINSLNPALLPKLMHAYYALIE